MLRVEMEKGIMQRGGNMSFVKSLIAVAAIAIAAGVSLQMVAGDDVAVVCKKLDAKLALSGYKNTKDETEKIFVFAKDWLTKHMSRFNSKRGKLITAWENVSKGEECSPSSWQHLLYTSQCNPFATTWTLNQQIKAYAKKCLTPDYVNEIVKSKTNNLFDVVNFVDAKFIQKFHLDNPDDWRIHVNWVGNRYWECYKPKYRVPGQLFPISCYDQDLNCCRPKKSQGALIDAIERDFANQGKDLATELQTSAAVSEYLEKKLFNPCKLAYAAIKDLFREITLVTEFYEGGQRDLIALLDQETKDFLFRQKYCYQIGLDQNVVLEKVEKYVKSKSQSS